MEAPEAMRRVNIVIRYYDSSGEVIFEGLPTLRHIDRVPVQWFRWEIYWDEELVESGTREPARAAGRRTKSPAPAAAARTQGGSDTPEA